MSVKELVKDLNVLPSEFTVGAVRFEVETIENSKGGWTCFIWQMDGTERIHIYRFKHGTTKEDAEKKMKQHILSV